MKIILKTIKVAFSIFVGLFMLLVIAGVASKTKATADINIEQAKQWPTTTAPAIPAAPSAPPVETTSFALSSGYEDNPIAADAQFRGKRTSVTGRVDRIGRSIDQSTYVVLSGDVQCEFPKSDEASVARLRKGQTVTITGTVSGLVLFNVYVAKCELTAVAASEAKLRTVKR